MSDDNPNLHVEFFNEPVLNKRKTAEAGRPIHDDVEHERIKFPGDTKRIHVAPAHEAAINHPETGQPWTYADRFPQHYEAFKSNQEYLGEGTAISELSFLSKSQVLNLKSQNVHTVETLAEVDGAQLNALGMGAREWKTKAIAYLERARGFAADNQLLEENKALTARIAALEAAASQPVTTPESASSPFEDWEDEDIKAWMKDNGGRIPPGTSNHATLVSKADELNKSLAEQAA